MPKILLDKDEIISLQRELKRHKRSKLEPDSNAHLIYKERYLQENIHGNSETLEDRLAAISVDIASAELEYSDDRSKVKELAYNIYDLLIAQKFIFNTPTMINFARYERDNDQLKQKTQMGAACFVLPLEDYFGDENSKEGMLDILKAQVLIHKAGGGTGFSFAKIRPSGSVIGWKEGTSSIDWNSNYGIASGPLSFLKYFYDASTSAVKQGNTRRGANMGIQRIDHPDFLDHIYAKYNKELDLVNFNLSLALTDNFMEAALKDEYYELYNPHSGRNLRKDELCTEKRFKELLDSKKRNPTQAPIIPGLYLHDNGKDIVNGYTGEVIGHIGYDKNQTVKIKARKVLEEIAKLAHSNGEPGVIFLDHINKFNPTPNLFKIESTNPCGEQPLGPFEACNLGSLNLVKFIRYKHKEAYFDFEDFKESIRIAVKALDNVIDRSDFPLKEIEDAVKKTRKVGLGLMGLADAMYLLGIKYNSEEGFRFAEEVARTLSLEAKLASAEIAEEKGVFPAFEGSIYDPDSEAHNKLKDSPINYDLKVRNATLTTQAPTGTTSRLCNCSSGIEPLFSLTYKSKIMGRTLRDVSTGFLEVAKKEGFYSSQLIEAIEKNGGSVEITEDTPEEIKEALSKIPEKWRKIFVVATGSNITPQDHIRMQAIFQKYNDSAISKTINLPSDATVEDVLNSYIDLWRSGCKGGTVYVDKSRQFQVLNTTKRQKDLKQTEDYKRPLAQTSITVELPIGNAFKTIGEYDEESDVVFTTVCFDPLEKRFTSVFQNISWGTSFDLIDLVGYGKSWSELVKLSGGKIDRLEKILKSLPHAHQAGIIRQDAENPTMIQNDTTQKAMLYTIYFLKYLTDSGNNFELKDIEQRYMLYRSGKVSLRQIIKSEGKIEERQAEGLPSILPKEETIKINYSNKKPKFCPYCKTENPPVRFQEGCLEYLCCGRSKCD